MKFNLIYKKGNKKLNRYPKLTKTLVLCLVLIVFYELLSSLIIFFLPTKISGFIKFFKILIIQK